MLASYWPGERQIDECIRTEAEELAEHVLLAVHEPMVLSKRPANSRDGELASEDALLEHLIKTDRPIPIIGESGVGKSHLIRWLDWKLRNHPETQQWHIRRIPKNASLRRVLEILLEGLEGDVFEQARKDVKKVGARLQTDQVADHLLVFMGHQLRDLYNETEREFRVIKESGITPDTETKKRIATIKQHAGKDSLPVLLTDSNFKKTLVEEGKCVFQIAQRLTSGSTDEELARNDYRLHPGDLDFSMQLDDLSLDARSYVRNKTLNSNEKKREEATDLLNQVLNEACIKTFQQFFKFNAGSFQELFADIRRHLKNRGQTLVILVEDMAAISAIEDVLIDSLLEEGVRDGVEEMCPIRSAIAVTEGYTGYIKRRNTLATRAQYEWYISKRAGEEESIYYRIEDFCGRYINAARYGQAALAEDYDPAQQSGDWPEIWRSDDSEETELANELDISPAGFPLFPLSKVAIKSLADKYCRPHETLEFDPRTILHQLLRGVLRDNRQAYLQKDFPPVGFMSAQCPTTLQMELQERVHAEADRAAAFAAIWGRPARNLQELASLVNPRLAELFHLKRLASILEQTDPADPAPKRPEPPRPDKKPKTPPTRPLPQPTADVAELVDEWFRKKAIPQSAANAIRKSLQETLNIYGKQEIEWQGAQNLPRLSSGNRTLIYIPYNDNNPSTPVAFLARDKDFNDPKRALVYKGFLIALLRYKEAGNWDYERGYTDYCRYTTFVDTWAKEEISRIVADSRGRLKDDFINHYKSALVLFPRIPGQSLNERLETLCTHDSVIAGALKSTGLDVWDEYRKKVLAKWSESQDTWLSWLSTNRHALEGDIALQYIRGLSTVEPPTEATRIVSQLERQLKAEFPHIELLRDCSTQEEYLETLQELSELVTQLKANAQYQGMEGSLGAKAYTNKIEKLLSLPIWRSANAFLTLGTRVSTLDGMANLNQVDREHLLLLDTVLSHWQVLFNNNINRIRQENSRHGLDRRNESRETINRTLSAIADEMAVLADPQ